MDATEEQIETAIEGLASMPEAMSFIRRYEFGRDLRILEESFDFALVADFDSESDYRRYAENPDHQAVIADRIRPILDQMARVQYWVG
jgi:hypothetical protein